MSPLDVLRLFHARLRARAIRVQEGFAVLGIAVGVALLFASQIASASLSHSVGELTREVVGRTQWELSARGPNGMSEALLGEVKRLPVRLALPLVEQSGVASGAGGARSVELFGTNPRQAQLAGTVLDHVTQAQLAHTDAVALPATLAGELGVEALEPVKLQLAGRTQATLVGATLGAREIGGLLDSPLVFAPLAYAQQLTHMQGRLSRIFVSARPGHEAAVHAGLASLAATSHLNLEPADWESALFATAFAPQDQSETLFSVICALVGFLLAANATLITVPSRRRLIEDLHLAGAGRGRTLEIMIIDAAVIGALGCAIGLAFGDALSRTLFAGNPGYLSFAFPIGSARIITWQSVAISIAAGMVAAVTGVLWPVRDILSPHEQPPDVRSSRRLLAWGLGAGLLCIALALAILLARPASASLGALALMIALICLLRPLFELAVIVFGALQQRLGGAASRFAILELRNSVTRVRSLAIVATAAVAVFGVLALAGAQSNLQHGLDRSARDIDASAQIWITAAGENNAFATTPISDTTTVNAHLQRVPGVASVGGYGGSFLNWGSRRLWVLAPPRNALQPIPTSQLINGGAEQAARAVRDGNGVLISQSLANEYKLHVGDMFTLPSPQPLRMRLAGLTTNLGWPPGAIIMSATNYARGWDNTPPSAYEIDARPGASLTQLRRVVARKIASDPALTVETVTQRERRHESLARQGLSRLTQIRWLMVIAAVLAITGALGALLWQRRERIAGLRVIGSGRGLLWRYLCYESAMLLAAGCAVGSIFGLIGQLMLSHALSTVTGFPIVFNIEVIALADCVLIGAAASIAAAAISYPVVGVPPSAASAYYYQ
jgi:putative ABC transport system permease protein